MKNKMDVPMENGKTPNEMLEEMKDLRVKAVMGTEVKPPLILLLENIIKTKPGDHEDSLGLQETLKSIKVKLEESLETSFVMLTVMEVSLLESIMSMLGAESSGVQTVDVETGKVLATTGDEKYIGSYITDVTEDFSGPTIATVIPESKTIH
jgi:hypothetical protein